MQKLNIMTVNVGRVTVLDYTKPAVVYLTRYTQGLRVCAVDEGEVITIYASPKHEKEAQEFVAQYNELVGSPLMEALK